MNISRIFPEKIATMTDLVNTRAVGTERFGQGVLQCRLAKSAPRAQHRHRESWEAPERLQFFELALVPTERSGRSRDRVVSRLSQWIDGKSPKVDGKPDAMEFLLLKA